MTVKNQKYSFNISILLTICILVICTISLVAKDLTYFIFNLILIFFILISLIFTKEYHNHFLFIFFFLIYSLSSLFVFYSQFHQFQMPANYADELGFYNVSFFFILEERPDWIAHYKLKDIDRIDWYLYFFLLSRLGKLFSLINDHSLLALKQTSVIFGALSVVYVNKLYFFFLKDRKKSIFLSTVFGLLPYTILNSSVLMRDIIIVFLTIFIILQVLYFNHLSNYYFAKLIIGLIALFSLRTENGLFMSFLSLSLILMYIIRTKITSNQKVVAYILIFILLFLSSFYIYENIITEILITSEKYLLKTSRSASAESFGILLLSLPFPINILSRFFYSQLNPFPMWGELKNNFALVIEIFGGLIWFPIFILSFITILIKKCRKKMSFELLALYLGALIFILFLSFLSGDPRRMMSVYPIVLLVGFYSYENFSKLSKKLYFMSFIFFILFLHIFYIVLKY